MRVAPLPSSQLPFVKAVLEEACAFDRAGDVANEKLFLPGPLSAPRAGEPPPALAWPTTFGAWTESNELVGIAASCGRWLRVLAVAPRARGRGAGTALLAACEQAGARRTLDQPGNYLAPGIDVRNTETISWLERRGWRRTGEPRTNVLIQVRDNPRVTAERARELAAAAAAKGYEVRRARPDEHALLDAVAAEFGGAWPFELSRALTYQLLLEYTGVRRGAEDAPPLDQAYVQLRPDEEALVRARYGDGAERELEGSRRDLARTTPGVHVALKDGQYCAFAAHDGNNMGLGWFGPTGTWPTHRGQGLGEALLVACLVDVAAEHERCEVAGLGPRAFYEKVAGIALDRHFVVLTKAD
jgi:GNAT superfamily N-acetyltransferase